MRKTAKDLAKDQRSISIARFFERNRQMLGFGSPARALVTTVKEGVDNSLDSCEEGSILPDINIEIRKSEKGIYKVIIEDNGPGIIKKQIPPIFGKFLYGSKFGRRVQSRGQQGVGISAVVLYSQLTTGNPTVIESVTKNQETRAKIGIDPEENEPQIISMDTPVLKEERGIRIEVDIESSLQSRNKLLDYIRLTSIANPHSEITIKEPKGNHRFKRSIDELPEKPKEIKPHPHGIELGDLNALLRNTDAQRLTSFLKKEFTSVGSKTAKKIEKNFLDIIDIEGKGKNDNFLIRQFEEQDLTRELLESMRESNVQAPPKNCLSPIKEETLEVALEKLDPEFITSETRSPKAYSGEPFVVEAALAYGKNIDKFELMRFANKVPLVYNKGGCVITDAVKKIDWNNYNIGPTDDNFVLVVHVASTNVPFTSESKDAIDKIPEIEKECELAIREISRNLKRYRNKRKRKKQRKERKEELETLYEIIAKNSADAAKVEKPDIKEALDNVTKN